MQHQIEKKKLKEAIPIFIYDTSSLWHFSAGAAKLESFQLFT